MTATKIFQSTMICSNVIPKAKKLAQVWNSDHPCLVNPKRRIALPDLYPSGASQRINPLKAESPQKLNKPILIMPRIFCLILEIYNNELYLKNSLRNEKPVRQHVKGSKVSYIKYVLAPAGGFEPPTLSLTGNCSTIELHRNNQKRKLL